jgi:hypothetical protein
LSVESVKSREEGRNFWRRHEKREKNIRENVVFVQTSVRRAILGAKRIYRKLSLQVEARRWKFGSFRRTRGLSLTGYELTARIHCFVHTCMLHEQKV